MAIGTAVGGIIISLVCGLCVGCGYGAKHHHDHYHANDANHTNRNALRMARPIRLDSTHSDRNFAETGPRSSVPRMFRHDGSITPRTPATSPTPSRATSRGRRSARNTGRGLDSPHRGARTPMPALAFGLEVDDNFTTPGGGINTPAVGLSVERQSPTRLSVDSHRTSTRGTGSSISREITPPPPYSVLPSLPVPAAPRRAGRSVSPGLTGERIQRRMTNLLRDLEQYATWVQNTRSEAEQGSSDYSRRSSSRRRRGRGVEMAAGGASGSSFSSVHERGSSRGGQKQQKVASASTSERDKRDRELEAAQLRASEAWGWGSDVARSTAARQSKKETRPPSSLSRSPSPSPTPFLSLVKIARKVRSERGSRETNSPPADMTVGTNTGTNTTSTDLATTTTTTADTADTAATTTTTTTTTATATATTTPRKVSAPRSRPRPPHLRLLPSALSTSLPRVRSDSDDKLNVPSPTETKKGWDAVSAPARSQASISPLPLPPSPPPPTPPPKCNANVKKDDGFELAELHATTAVTVPFQSASSPAPLFSPNGGKIISILPDTPVSSTGLRFVVDKEEAAQLQHSPVSPQTTTEAETKKTMMMMMMTVAAEEKGRELEEKGMSTVISFRGASSAPTSPVEIGAPGGGKLGARGSAAGNRSEKKGLAEMVRVEERPITPSSSEDEDEGECEFGLRNGGGLSPAPKPQQLELQRL